MAWHRYLRSRSEIYLFAGPCDLGGPDTQGRSDRGGMGGVYTPPIFLGQSVIFYFTR